MKAISLFSGAGGLDIGFQRAGFSVLAAIEIDPSCCDTLRKNLRNTRIIEADIRSVKGSELLCLLGLKAGDIDVVFGGPPCQSFSLAGKRKGLEDERGQLLAEFIRVVRELKPRSFVLENVKGMANWSEGAALNYVKGEFQRLGYEVVHSILNAASFGAPQFRERLFVVGTSPEKRFHFPLPTHSKDGETPRTLPHKTVGEAIFDLPPPSPPSSAAMRTSRTIADRIEKHGY